MFTEEFILGMVLCTALFLMSWVGRSLPLRMVSSLGFVYLALDWWSRTDDLFGMGLLILIAFGAIFLGREK